MGGGSTWPYQPHVLHEGDSKECVQHYTFTSPNGKNTVKTQQEAQGHRSLLCADWFPHAVTTTEKQQSCTPRTEPTGCVPHPAYCSLDVLCGPLNSAGQSSPLESSGMKVIKGNIRQVAVDFFQLLEDDTTFLLDLRLFQCTVLHNVSKKLYNCNTFPMLAILLPDCYPVVLKGEKTHRQQGHCKRNEQQTTLGRGCNLEMSTTYSHSIKEGQTTLF